MKAIVTIVLIFALFISSKAQSVSLGVNVSPRLENGKLTTFAPSLQIEIKKEDFNLYISASNEKLVIGVFLGNVFEVGAAYKAFVGDSRNYLQLGFRVNKEFKNGYRVQIGSFVDIGLINDNLVTYTPIQIGLTKTII